MGSSRAVQHDVDNLTIGAKVVVVLTGLLSLPSYLALLMLLSRYLLMIVTSNRNFREFSEWAYILEFLSLPTGALSLVLATVASFLPINRRGKLLAWIIATGGVLAWLSAGSMLPRNIW